MAKKKTTKKTTKKKTAKKSTPNAVQPEVNIGMIGHVDHGKTTLVQVLSGKWADTHSEEMKRGITIRLGYADVAFYKYPNAKGIDAYGVLPESKNGDKGELLRKISLIDAPGHESLMATMLCGANIMDGALLLVSAAEECPQPQTREHLQALEIVGVEKLIIIQNKIDLVSEEQAKKNYDQIKAFLQGSRYEDAPIIPMSAKHAINLDILIETMISLPAAFLAARSNTARFARATLSSSYPVTKSWKKTRKSGNPLPRPLQASWSAASPPIALTQVAASPL